MSRRRRIPLPVKAGFGLLLLAAASSVIACGEDSKTAPDRCADPALPIFDIQAAGVPADDNAQYPCSTKVGHSVSSIGTADTTPTGGGGSGSAGKSSGGSAGKNSGGSAGKNSGGSGGLPNLAGTGGT